MTCRCNILLLVCLLAGVASCDDKRAPTRQPPPKPVRATCTGEPVVNDPSNLALFPSNADSFCIDPNGSDKGYGEGTPHPLDGICDLFDGECETYKGLQVRRVVKARYVDGNGSGATIDVTLSKFSSAHHAYAMFTKRVVGGGDPAHPDSPKPIEGGGAAALGWGNAYLWRGAHLAEITYNDIGTASDKQIKAVGDKLLPPLVVAFGAKLPGKLELPAAAAALPTDNRLPLGVRFVTKDVLGIAGTGDAAFGYYKDGTTRWRVLSIVKADEDATADVMTTFTKVDGAAAEKQVGEGGARFMVSRVEWIVARKGSNIVGVGDEARVLREGMSAAEHRVKTLDQDAKRKLLTALLSR